MLQLHDEHTNRLRLALPALIMTFLFGCTTTPPETVRVKNAALPNYIVNDHRVEEAIDLYIEPQIRNLRVDVTPDSNAEAFSSIPVLVGPSLEQALVSITRQHFSKSTMVDAPAGRPTLSYELLTYRPAVAVVPGAGSTRLNVSARLALQITIHAASGEQLFSTTAIGTSHVSDTKLAPGDRMKDGARLLEVATRDAIIDAMYDISSIFGNSNDIIQSDVLTSEIDPNFGIETFDDVVLTLRTRREEDRSN